MTGCNLAGKIPSSIGKLGNLQKLHLNSNNLVGSIPEEILHLGNLEELNLGMNQLNGPILKGLLCPQSALERLYLHCNFFNGALELPELVAFQKLKEFDVSFNHLCGIVPAPIFQIESL